MDEERRGWHCRVLSKFNNREKKQMVGLDGNNAKSVPISKQMVYDGYLRVKANKGGSGVDRMTLEELESDLENHLYKLWNRLSSGSYFPPAVKRIYIPKEGKSQRPLGIPTVLDRIAQSVLKGYCEPRLEAIFSDKSYGYRPGRNAHGALESARKNCWRRDWVIDMDIKGYFDNINHELMLKSLERQFEEKWVLLYMNRWLTAGVLHEGGYQELLERGTPQGGVVSPLLSNLFLHYVFDKWMELNYGGVEFERYADDIIVHCRTEGEAEYLLEKIRERLCACDLELHPEKTRIVYCQDGRRKLKTQRPRKFTFLSYDFKPRKKWNKREHKAFTGFDLGISHKSQIRIRGQLRERMQNMAPQLKLEDIAESLNAKLRGWTTYFAKLNRYALRGLWNWFNYRLVKWIMRSRKRFKRRLRAAARYLRFRYRLQPNLFAHWIFGWTPF